MLSAVCWTGNLTVYLEINLTVYREINHSYSFPDNLEISDGAKRLVRRILQSRPEARPTIEEILQDEWFLGQGLALLQGREEVVAQVRKKKTAASLRPHTLVAYGRIH